MRFYTMGGLDEYSRLLGYLKSCVNNCKLINNFLSIMNIEQAFKLSYRDYIIITDLFKEDLQIYINDENHHYDSISNGASFVSINRMNVDFPFIRNISYYKNGVRNRNDGPADILFNKEGNVTQESYFLNNKFHRFGNPAVKEYCKGICFHYLYYLNGKLHNAVGPASYTRYINGFVNISYYLDDKIISQHAFVEHLSNSYKEYA